MPNEADNCRKFVVPKLQAGASDNDPHSIAEEPYFTDGRIVAEPPSSPRRDSPLH